MRKFFKEHGATILILSIIVLFTVVCVLLNNEHQKKIDDDSTITTSEVLLKSDLNISTEDYVTTYSSTTFTESGYLTWGPSGTDEISFTAYCIDVARLDSAIAQFCSNNNITRPETDYVQVPYSIYCDLVTSAGDSVTLNSNFYFRYGDSTFSQTMFMLCKYNAPTWTETCVIDTNITTTSTYTSSFSFALNKLYNYLYIICPRSFTDTDSLVYDSGSMTIYTSGMSFTSTVKDNNINYISITSYNALKENYSKLAQTYIDTATQLSTLQQQYDSLSESYNTLADGTYTFQNLFWSIGTVPFAVLASGFNVDVLGVNLAGVITGLLTACVLIWLIKKFLK